MTNEQWLVYLWSIYPQGGFQVFWVACLAKEYFWYKNDLVKFHETQKNLGLLLQSARGCSYYPAEKNFEDFCEPYIGKLPSNLKQDNKIV